MVSGSQGITYGNSSGPGIYGYLAQFNDANVVGFGPPNDSIHNEHTPLSGPFTIVANGSPALVPVVQPDAIPVGNNPVVPSSIGNTGGGRNATVQASAPSLLGTVENIIAHPGQHIIGAIVLAVLAWWFYKHVLKKV